MVILLYSEAFPYNTRIGINSPACCQLFAVGAYGCMASFLYPADTSERVTLVPIFYFIKNQSPAPLFLLFTQKVTLCLRCSLASALTTLRLAANFLRMRLRRRASFLSPEDTSEQAVYRLLRLFSKVRAYSFRCSSFSAKGRVRVACSLVNALTTALAHYQPFAGTQGSCIFFVVPFQSECLYGHSDFYFSSFVMNIGTNNGTRMSADLFSNHAVFLIL